MAGLSAAPPGEGFDLESIEADLQRFQEDEVVRDALGRGVDLRQYARQVDADLRALQAGSVPDFIEEAPATAALYAELSDCDTILASMENILEGFQADLGGISDEIRHLQDESLSMNVKLKNRRAVETRLGAVLQHLVLPEQLIVGICQADVNDDYLQLVHELDAKMRFVRAKQPLDDATTVAPSDMIATQEVEPQLERLRLKAVAKVRLFLLDKIEALKKPKTNVQIMQQNVLLKFRYFVTFLGNHAPAVAEEIKGTYVDAMSRVLYNLFKSYWSSLAKLQKPGPPKEDVVAAEELALSACSSLPASLFTPPDKLLGQRAAAVAAREQELGDPDASPIIVHVAKSGGAQFYFEAIFRSVQKHLMDSATSEFLFILDFFEVKNSDLFNQIFARTLSLCLENLENYLYTCYDPVALMLMIRTTQAHRLLMERRRVPCLDGYFDHVNMLLWPQFKKVFDMHLRSVQKANLAKLGAPRLGLQAHYVSRRYAEFAATVYALSTSLSTSDEMLPLNLKKLREAYVDLLDRLVQTALQNRQHHRVLATKKGSFIFRINNLDDALANFDNAAHPDDITAIEELLAHDTALYIEEELASAFSAVIDLIRAAEDDEGEGAALSDRDFMPLVQEFAASWKSGLEMLNTSVGNYFSSKDYSREVLKQMLTQFLLYYTRFQDIVKRHSDSRVQGRLVSTQEIMGEMKKYSRGP